MKKIEQEIKKCNLCKNLMKLKCQTISYGKNTNLLFIGESPAKNGWIKSGKAFYDINNKLLPTGKVLDRLLKIINLSIDDITFTEACKCALNSRKELKQSSFNCFPFLERQINKLNAKILIPLGEYPTRILLNDIKFKKFSDVVGKIYKKKIGTLSLIIIPIYHPSPINPKGYKDNIEIFNLIKRCH
jgi:uracil-DNA glycosylase family 4